MVQLSKPELLEREELTQIEDQKQSFAEHDPIRQTRIFQRGELAQIEIGSRIRNVYHFI